MPSFVLALIETCAGRDAEHTRESFAHRRNVRPESGRFTNDGHIHIDRLVILALQQPVRLRQQLQRVRAVPPFVRRRKVCANVAERGGAEQRVRDRMRDRIRIRMAGQTAARTGRQRPPESAGVQRQNGANRSLMPTRIVRYAG